MVAASHPKFMITILGTGVWGTTLAELARTRGHQVQVWGRRSCLSLVDVIADADLILSAVSMPGVIPITQQLQQVRVSEGTTLISATKGLDPLSCQTPSQLWTQAFPDHPLVVLSGPNLSKEIRQGLPTASVAASHDPSAAEQVQLALSSERFRIYTSSDPLGVELGGTLKNVIAIAVGVCDGLHLGSNARAALITRGLKEIIRCGQYWGAHPETFVGLSGLGDLLATCTSPLSRNYQVGYGLAQGIPLPQILESLEGTAEGMNTAAVLMQIAQQYLLDLPITEQVYRLVQGQISASVALDALMERMLKPE
jgi:glycerol-3-phosphate dehydrogenase (NAD(P)+)